MELAWPRLEGVVWAVGQVVLLRQEMALVVRRLPVLGVQELELERDQRRAVFPMARCRAVVVRD